VAGVSGGPGLIIVVSAGNADQPGDSLHLFRWPCRPCPCFDHPHPRERCAVFALIYAAASSVTAIPAVATITKDAPARVAFFHRVPPRLHLAANPTTTWVIWALSPRFRGGLAPPGVRRHAPVLLFDLHQPGGPGPSALPHPNRSSTSTFRRNPNPDSTTLISRRVPFSRLRPSTNFPFQLILWFGARYRTLCS